MTTLLQRMHDELVRRNYAATTIRESYLTSSACRSPHRDVGSIGSVPTRSGAIRRILFEEQKLAVGTVGLHVAALRFFFVPCPQAAGAEGGPADPKRPPPAARPSSVPTKSGASSPARRISITARCS